MGVTAIAENHFRR